MASIIIGGGNLNAARDFTDELARQRQLALQEAEFSARQQAMVRASMSAPRMSGGATPRMSALNAQEAQTGIVNPALSPFGGFRDETISAGVNQFGRPISYNASSGGVPQGQSMLPGGFDAAGNYSAPQWTAAQGLGGAPGDITQYEDRYASPAQAMRVQALARQGMKDQFALEDQSFQRQKDARADALATSLMEHRIAGEKTAQKNAEVAEERAAETARKNEKTEALKGATEQRKVLGDEIEALTKLLPTAKQKALMAVGTKTEEAARFEYQAKLDRVQALSKQYEQLGDFITRVNIPEEETKKRADELAPVLQKESAEKAAEVKRKDDLAKSLIEQRNKQNDLAERKLDFFKKVQDAKAAGDARKAQTLIKQMAFKLDDTVKAGNDLAGSWNAVTQLASGLVDKEEREALKVTALSGNQVLSRLHGLMRSAGGQQDKLIAALTAEKDRLREDATEQISLGLDRQGVPVKDTLRNGLIQLGYDVNSYDALLHMLLGRFAK